MERRGCGGGGGGSGSIWSPLARYRKVISLRDILYIIFG